MGKRKQEDYFGLLPLLRFVTGGVIGFYAVALFSTNAYVAVLVAVTCGCVLDRYFARKNETDE